MIKKQTSLENINIEQQKIKQEQTETDIKKYY